MKKLALFAIFIATASFGQISITTFSFLNKHKIGEGVGVSYDLPNNTNTIGLQFKNNEIWNIFSEVNKSTTLRTMSFQYCFREPEPKKTKWLVDPAAGVIAGLGMSKKSDQELYNLLEYPYFFGVFLQIGESLRLSDHSTLTGFVKVEGLAGVLTQGENVYKDASTNCNIMLGLKLTFTKKTKSFTLSKSHNPKRIVAFYFS